MKNVVLLTIDTLRKDVLGCYGDSGGLTPFIDSLQSRCMRFTKAHATGPYTRASFPAILTSTQYLEYGIYKMLPRKKVLVSEVLKKAGIVTAAFHSNPYLSDYFGWNRGWDTFYDSLEDDVNEISPYVKASEINKKVKTWLSSYKGKIDSRPLFLWTHYMDVHEPYIPQRKYIDLVDPSVRINEDEMLRLFKDVVLKRDTSDPDKINLLNNLYRAHVREVDDAIKEFFEMLSDYQMLKDTAVIMASDHGEEFGEHGGLSHDGKMYSELVNVPLMFFDATRREELVSDKLVSTIDIPPTILSLFSLKNYDQFQGTSLFPLETYPEEIGVYGEALQKHGSREKGQEREVHFYRKGDAKIIYRESDDTWELYDLESDPKEKYNIIGKSPISEEMKGKVLPKIGRYK